MLHRFPAPAVLLLGALLLSGCANDTLLGPNALTTSAVPTPPPADPACVTLASQIDTLRKDGIADKIEKAAAKKHKMTPADLTKADQLTKANADFKAKCSTLPAKSVTMQTSSSPAQGTAAASPPKGPPVTTLSAAPPAKQQP